MNLVDRYLTECVYNRNYNWMTGNLYINEGELYCPTFGQQEILLTRDSKKAFLLPRSAGATTLICMDAITEAMLNPGTEIIIFSHNQGSCRYTASKIRNILIYSNINTSFMSSERIELENRSVIKVMPPLTVHYRGCRPNTVYIDNFDMFNSEDLSNIFNRLMLQTEKILILGNNMNDFESTQRMININPRLI